MEKASPSRVPHPGDNLIGTILRSLQGKQVCVELTNDFEVVGLLHHSANDLTTTLKDAKACRIGGWGDEVQQFDTFTAQGKHIRAVHIPRAINLSSAVASHLGALKYAQNRNRKNKRDQGSARPAPGAATNEPAAAHAPKPAPGARPGQRAPPPRAAIVLGAGPAVVAEGAGDDAGVGTTSNPVTSTGTGGDDFDWNAIGAAIDSFTLPNPSVTQPPATTRASAPVPAPVTTPAAKTAASVPAAAPAASPAGVAAGGGGRWGPVFASHSRIPQQQQPQQPQQQQQPLLRQQHAQGQQSQGHKPPAPVHDQGRGHWGHQTPASSSHNYPAHGHSAHGPSAHSHSAHSHPSHYHSSRRESNRDRSDRNGAYRS